MDADLQASLIQVGEAVLAFMGAGVAGVVVLAGASLGFKKAWGIFMVAAHGGYGYSERSLRRYDEWRHGS